MGGGVEEGEGSWGRRTGGSAYVGDGRGAGRMQRCGRTGGLVVRPGAPCSTGRSALSMPVRRQLLVEKAQVGFNSESGR